jgi:hypothetical protein
MKMKKIFKHIFFFTAPVLILIILLFFLNIIQFDFKYGHQSSMVYKKPLDVHKYFIFNKLNNFKKTFIKKKKLDNIQVVNFFIEEQRLKKLLSKTPYSTKEWVKGKMISKNDMTQQIQLRYRGDNPTNWLFEKKSFKIKTKKNELINNTRSFDYLTYSANLFSSYYLSKKMLLLTQDAKIVDVNINGKKKGLYIELNRIDESLLRNNRFMPVNIYKGENQATERVLGLNGNLLNNTNLWSKLSTFNQRNKNDFSDLKRFLKSLNKHSSLYSSDVENYVDKEYFSRFEAFLTLTQNIHHDWYHNLRFVSDPWRGKFYQMITDPIIYENPPGKNFLIDFVSNDFNKHFNVKSDFIHAKYISLYNFIKKNDVTSDLGEYFETIENDLKNSNIIEPYSLFRTEYISDYKKVLQELNNNKNKIIKILEKDLNKSYWSFENNIELVVAQNTPLSNIDLFYENDLPEWIGIDKNYNGKIDETEMKFFPKRLNGKKINLPIILYSNRTNQTSRDTHMHQEFEIKNVYTRFQLISSNNAKPSKISTENYFNKKSYNLKLKKMNTAVRTNKDNIIIKKNKIDKQEIVLSGNINIRKTKIFNNPVRILSNTKFNIYPDQHIIFKDKVIAEGNANEPIIFKKFKTNNLKKNNIKLIPPWGSVAFLGKKTKNSVLNYVNFEGGSGGTFNQFSLIAMLSIHNAEDINIMNSSFLANEIYDDTIHIVYSQNINLTNVNIKNAYSDAIDIDISKDIHLDKVNILNPKNDGVDIMKSFVKIENLIVEKSNDKGISIGEKSNVIVRNSSFNNNLIGVAVKDGSTANIYNSNFNNNSYQLAGYAKNWRYGGGGDLKVFNSNFISKTNKFIVTADPVISNNDLNLKLKQNSKIKIINSIVEGKISKTGANIFFN